VPHVIVMFSALDCLYSLCSKWNKNPSLLLKQESLQYTVSQPCTCYGNE